MKENATEYNYLLGKSKRDVLSYLGEGFNFYPDNTWIYDIDKTWWGRCTSLLLKFDGFKVKKISLISSFGKIKHEKYR
ncbi:hypothetical protein ATE49_16655 [Elizabethkingia miricola]|uniref:Uncharacterized protein n=1 Tax=Elizabethkingia miricola TaxID=172045 RepID=A0ABY3NGE8_ELIMR|nr:hypothetical protein [Elizabethkingia miricola]OBS11206.1 hypothetical protein ATE49_16655 [Elizabethkingia miricola]TYO91803.1 hypothetical protein LX74_02049 [Elizabethkingia miricola]